MRTFQHHKVYSRRKSCGWDGNKIESHPHQVKLLIAVEFNSFFDVLKHKHIQVCVIKMITISRTIIDYPLIF
jgi:hypothetical protein